MFHFYTPVDTGRKLKVHKTFRRRPGRLLNVLCTFNLRPVSTGTPVKHQKAKGFLMFSGGIEIENWSEKVKIKTLKQKRIISEIYSTNAQVS